VAGDVTDGERMREVVCEAAAAFGRVDVWVNNAGTSLWGPFEDIPLRTHTLRPVPPVVSPERVAEAIAELSLRPARARRVGTMHAVSAAYALAPSTVGRLAAQLGGWYFLRAGEPANATDGGLFTARPGPASGRGGWGRRQRLTARVVAASAAAVAARRHARRRT
jgi:NAD(P)-dependent dehydrogenase (short-subunit alcohol dehydrogenase family)